MSGIKTSVKFGRIEFAFYISHAKGEWILFLNAGDVFAETNVLTRVLPFTKRSEEHTSELQSH